MTGGTGFLGSRLVRRYLADGSHVSVIARTKTDDLPAEAELVELDLSNSSHGLVDAFVDQGLVIHAAAVKHAVTPRERALQESANVGGTKRVLDACRKAGVPRLIHVSTTAAVGISEDPDRPADESFRFNLEDSDVPYSHTKHRAEQLVLKANGSAFAATVVNPGVMFGAHRGGYRGSEVLERVLRRRFIPYTDGGLSVVHVDDVVDGICKVDSSARSGERYILSGENLSFRDIARTIGEVANQRKMLFPLVRPLQDLLRLYAITRGRPALHLDRLFAHQYYSSEKAEIELGYEPRPFARIVVDALEHLAGLGSGSQGPG